ncbi:hypothetical protein [Bacteroides sp.]|uniref:hypothetical protein n=1 Tax=Bacteroides sp. TaxID=29523 RepID=UPI00260D69B4|nr:hypothetical protein [Bacteroides sp.]MDD3040909.1 hypothetical protein [Bacteroides sp.]
MSDTIVQQKIGFLLCESPALDSGKFILQAGGNQYLYQILAFDSQNQYDAFRVMSKEKFLKIAGYRIVIRLSCALQNIQTNQVNAKEVLADANSVMSQALDWYKENYVTGIAVMNSYKEDQP